MATRSISFLKKSKKDCLIIYKDILANSDTKWESGKKLAEHGDYGSAISLAVVSIEELVKSLIVLLDGHGFKFRSVKGIKVFFHDHQIRFVIAFLMFVFNSFGEELMRFVKNWRENPKSYDGFIANIQNNEDNAEKTLKPYLFRKMIALKKELDWFSKVDLFRQDGFYSDYDENFKTPINITLDDYKEVMSRLEKVRSAGKGFISVFTSEDEIYTKQLDRLKADFVKYNYYGSLESALSNVKRNNGNPFELIFKIFQKEKSTAV